MTSLDTEPEVIFPNVRRLVNQYETANRSYENFAKCIGDGLFLSRNDHPNYFTCPYIAGKNMENYNNSLSDLESTGIEQTDDDRETENQSKLKLLNPKCRRPSSESSDLGNSFKWQQKSVSENNLVENHQFTNKRLQRLDSGAGDLFDDKNHLRSSWSKESLSSRHSRLSDCRVSVGLTGDSMDNLPCINRSVSFDHLLGPLRSRVRSTSSDSAVIVEGEISSSGISASPSPGTSPITDIIPFQDSECRAERSSERDNVFDEVVLRNSNQRSICGVNYMHNNARPPSVVISDHSENSVSVHIAFAPDGFSLEDAINSSSDYFLNDGYVCPRKVSECSTCSSVSTIDMNSTGMQKTSFDLTAGEWKSSPLSRKNSDCSSCYLTASDDEVEVSLQQPTPPTIRKKNMSSNWRKVRNVVQWTPFIQTYKRHKYPWVQLAGHQGNFRAGYKQGTILKKLCPSEQEAFECLMKDMLRPYVPEYLGVVEQSDNERYLQLQDLLGDFSSACVMDIKMGVRTYLEEELAKARIKPKLRKDMYEKMVQIDSKAPTEAEHRAKAVTKPRYMVWRETISSTATLGFRIEGVRRGDGYSSKDFKTTKTREQVAKVISDFMKGYPEVMSMYVQRLKDIRNTLEKSTFFTSHELIGSSLLFVHNEEKCGVWLIDFAKTVPLPPNVNISHKAPWIEGTHEDGYLIGFENLVDLIEKFDNNCVESTSSSEETVSSSTSTSSSGDSTSPSTSSPPNPQQEEEVEVEEPLNATPLLSSETPPPHSSETQPPHSSETPPPHSLETQPPHSLEPPPVRNVKRK